MSWQVIDKNGRVARRCMDEHTMRTFSDPRTSTSIRRMSALLAFSANPRMLSRQVVRPL
jgi:hypothetical protein